MVFGGGVGVGWGGKCGDYWVWERDEEGCVDGRDLCIRSLGEREGRW